MTLILGDMFQVPIDFSELHQKYMRGKSAAKLYGSSKFLLVGTGKVIEMTLKRWKMKGGR